ncbi:uncharacterized protein LOC144333285 [Macaca mulatta]
MKPQTLAVSVTVLENGVSGVCSFRRSDVSGASSFWQVRGLAVRSEAADLRGECYSSSKAARLKLLLLPGGFVVSLASGVKLQTVKPDIKALPSPRQTQEASWLHPVDPAPGLQAELPTSPEPCNRTPQPLGSRLDQAPRSRGRCSLGRLGPRGSPLRQA